MEAVKLEGVDTSLNRRDLIVEEPFVELRDFRAVLEGGEDTCLIVFIRGVQVVEVGYYTFHEGCLSRVKVFRVCMEYSRSEAVCQQKSDLTKKLKRFKIHIGLNHEEWRCVACLPLHYAGVPYNL
jgi:hypothetical protein